MFAFGVTPREILHSSGEHSRLYGFDEERGETFIRRTCAAHASRRSRLGSSKRPRDRIAKERISRRIVFSPSGDVHEFVGILMDVTVLRRADEERERLLAAHA
jgi:hypothetical protein